MPTLIAGIFCANTRIPGQGDWGGFDVMIALMAASGAATYLLFTLLNRSGRRGPD